MFSKLLGWRVLATRADTSMEIEILVLGHQLAVQQRRTPHRRMSSTDRGVIAASRAATGPPPRDAAGPTAAATVPAPRPGARRPRRPRRAAQRLGPAPCSPVDAPAHGAAASYCRPRPELWVVPAWRTQTQLRGLRRQSTNHTSARSAAAIPCSAAMRSNASASFDDSSTTISVSPSGPALASTA